MLGLKVDAPFYREIKLLPALLQNFHRLGIADSSKLVGDHVVQPVKQALIHKGVEKFHLLGALFQHGVDDILDHGLCHVHIVVQIGKSHFRLDHPELRRVALGIGDLGTESGAEGVHIAEGHGKVFAVELTGDSETGGLAEKVLAVVHGAVLFPGRVIQIQGGDTEHLPRALTVGAGDDGGVDIHKALALEKVMHGLCRHASHTKYRGEQVGAGTKMLDRPEKFHTVALFLQGIVRR